MIRASAPRRPANRTVAPRWAPLPLLLALVIGALPAGAQAQGLSGLAAGVTGRTEYRGETAPDTKYQPGSVVTSRWPGGYLNITATGGRNDPQAELARRVMRRAAEIARTSGKPLIKLSSDGPALSWDQAETQVAGTADRQQVVTQTDGYGIPRVVGEYTVPGDAPRTVRGPRLPLASLVVRPLTLAEADALVAEKGQSRAQLYIYDVAALQSRVGAD